MKIKLESKFGNVSLILITVTSTYIDSLAHTTVIVNYLYRQMLSNNIFVHISLSFKITSL